LGQALKGVVVGGRVDLEVDVLEIGGRQAVVLEGELSGRSEKGAPAGGEPTTECALQTAANSLL
jgi:hypothetical protein